MKPVTASVLLLVLLPASAWTAPPAVGAPAPRRSPAPSQPRQKQAWPQPSQQAQQPQQQQTGSQRTAWTGSRGRNLGLGLMLGEPAGLTATFEIQPNEELRPLLAYSFSKLFYFSLAYDFRFPKAQWLPNALSNWVPYAGISGLFIFSSSSDKGEKRGPFDSGDTFGVALQVPLGMQYRLRGSPLEFGVELAPGLGVAPGTYFRFQGGLTVTWFFN